MAKLSLPKKCLEVNFYHDFFKLGLVITGGGGTQASVYMWCREDRGWSRFSFTFTWVLKVRFRYKSWVVSILTH